MRDPSWLGRALVVGAVVLIALAGFVALRSRATRRADAPPDAGERAGERAPAGPAGARPAGETPPEAAGPSPLDDPQARMWSIVDLNALRAEMPNNLYWKMAVPTKDPEVLREREAERERWNVEYGKVLSSTATAEEVDAYYAQRYQLSSDYVQLATYLLADYGERLPQRDVALLKLAIEMHLARLEEIPRQIVDAHERCEAHDAARRKWLEDQKAFDR